MKIHNNRYFFAWRSHSRFDEKIFWEMSKELSLKRNIFTMCVTPFVESEKFFFVISFWKCHFHKKGYPLQLQFHFWFSYCQKGFFKVSMHNFCHCLADSQKKTIKYLKIACLSNFTKNCWKLFHTHSQTISDSEVLNVGP